MPRLAINYNNTIVYKIVCKDVNIKECYVGHTTKFATRKNEHKYACNTPESKKYNIYIYTFIRNNGGWDNWSMIEVEKYPCENKLEAEKRERYWVETLKAELNKIVPSRTVKEYYIANKEKIKQYAKDYKLKNKETIKLKNKIYKDTIKK
jgi:hypothetical protein